jgi:hypothetical protein
MVDGDITNYKEVAIGDTLLNGSGLYAVTHPVDTREVKVTANLPRSFRTTLDFDIIPGDEINEATVISVTHYARVGFNFSEVFYG